MNHRVYDGSVNSARRWKRKQRIGTEGTIIRTWQMDVKQAQAIEPVRWREHLKLAICPIYVFIVINEAY